MHRFEGAVEMPGYAVPMQVSRQVHGRGYGAYFADADRPFRDDAAGPPTGGLRKIKAIRSLRGRAFAALGGMTGVSGDQTQAKGPSAMRLGVYDRHFT
jgi:hypothetical protein